MSWQTVRPQIKSLLENLTANGDKIFQEVSATPKFEFSGYPAAYVIQSDNEADYNTNTENIRTYAFIVRAFYSTKSIGVATAVERLEKIVDQVIDAIDEDAAAGQSRVIGASLPTKYTFVNILAMPSVFGEVEGQELVMAELKVKVKILYDIT